ncbi:MAG: polyprenyl synthetase family protein [Candidatus Eisenbacteria sp.]|nr:polyprenyl synthetase family protein [Candidatus Eisenbacteria bacterium]
MPVEDRSALAAVDKAKQYLAENAVAVNPVLEQFWEAKRREWQPLGESVAGAADAYCHLTANGKKIRAGLVKMGYDACHHESSPRSTVANGVLRAAGSVEILHNAFLIHDDIVDHSDLRRSAPTVHRRYADKARSRFNTELEALAYGQAVALNFGDKGQALAQELLLSSGFPEGVLLRAVTLLSEVTIDTVAGQLLDVADVKLCELTEAQVLRIHEYKTAHYTVMLPLLLGGVLAGVHESVLEGIRSYAIPIGIAFQIQDDILGLYGDSDVLGKPVDSDVKEGKKTLLFVHAYEAGSAQERSVLERVHGNSDLAPGDLERVREIVRSTGALSRSEELARKLVRQGKDCIQGTALAPHWKRILGGLADYFILRRY